MGKFSAAKMTGAQDVKFQNAFNQLIDLLDTGYVAESMMGGHKVRVSVDPKGGMQILSDGVQIGGVILINGVPVNVAGAITDDATAPGFWAKIGSAIIGGLTTFGIFGYRKGTSAPVYGIVNDGSYTRFIDNDGTDRARIGNDFAYKDTDGVLRVLIDQTGECYFYDRNGINRMGFTTAGATYMRSPNGLNTVYVNNTDGYKNLNGVITTL